MQLFRKSLLVGRLMITAALWFNLVVAQTKADSWSLTGSLSGPRVFHSATLLANGQVLVAGGSDCCGTLSRSELYDPTQGTWTTVGSMKIGRSSPTATLLQDGKLLVAGGSVTLNSGGFTPTSSTELYDPATQIWSLAVPMNAPRADQQAVLLANGKVLIVGGTSDTGVTILSSAEIYDPAEESWTPTGTMNTARLYFTATVLPDGRVLVAGGRDGEPAYLSSAELFDPATGLWTPTGSMNFARSRHTAILLSDGRVLVAGGMIGGPNPIWLSSAELYDPSTGTWTLTGSMNSTRSDFTATLLPSGTVLVAGGEGTGLSAPGCFTSTEIYDPTFGSWSTSASLNFGRQWHTATLLPNQGVLVAGGDSCGLGPLSSAELYQPRSPAPLSCPADIVTGTDPNQCSAVVEFSTPTATNGFGNPLAVTCFPASGSVFPLGTTTVTCTANDGSSCSFTVTVNDTQPPTLACPANLSIDCSVALLEPVSFQATTSDTCDPNPLLGYSIPPGSGFPVGTTIVTCTSIDSSGNQSNCSFNITRAPLDFTGFLAPIGGADSTGGSFAAPVRTFKMGSTIPVKFSAACGGAPVLTGVHRLQVTQYTSQTTDGIAIDATPTDAATTGEEFLLSTSQWMFNLNTQATCMSVGIWKLTATLCDGSQHSAWIQLK